MIGMFFLVWHGVCLHGESKAPGYQNMILTASHSATVSAPARLHMGFLDLNGSLGRRFGSLGMALEELATQITAYPDPRVSAEGPQAARAEA